MRRALGREGISLFAMAAGRVIVDERSANLDRYIRHISPQIEQVDNVLDHACWREDPGPTAVVAIGPMAAIEQAEPGVRAEAVQVLRYDVPGGFGVSSLAIHPRDASKGQALSTVAAELGIPIEQTVAVGDWLNDVSMFRKAGRSFAMGHAPAEVAAAASDVLSRDRSDGGAIAELVERVWG
jgi:hydroxymethylpyrimidine pyrophosphatase-like HAD family hydrolase